MFEHSLPLCICTACIGYSLGTLFAISGPLVSDLFGLKYFGMIFGLIFTSYGFIGGLVGPLLASVVLNTTHSFVLCSAIWRILFNRYYCYCWRKE